MPRRGISHARSGSIVSRLSCGTASHLVNAQRRVIGVVWNEEFAVENRTSTREKIFQRSFHVWRQIFLEFGVSLDKFLSLISEVREREREREVNCPEKYKQRTLSVCVS